MTSAQVVETSVTNNSSFQNYPHPDDHTIRNTGDSILFRMRCISEIGGAIIRGTWAVLGKFFSFRIFCRIFLCRVKHSFARESKIAVYPEDSWKGTSNDCLSWCFGAFALMEQILHNVNNAQISVMRIFCKQVHDPIIFPGFSHLVANDNQAGYVHI